MVYKYTIKKEGIIIIKENGEINIVDKDDNKKVLQCLTKKDAIKADYRELDNLRNSRMLQANTFLKGKFPGIAKDVIKTII